MTSQDKGPQRSHVLRNGVALTSLAAISALSAWVGLDHAVDLGEGQRFLPAVEASRIATGTLAGLVGFVAVGSITRNPGVALLVGTVGGAGLMGAGALPPDVHEVTDRLIPDSWFNTHFITEFPSAEVSPTDPVNALLIKHGDTAAALLLTQHPNDPHITRVLDEYSAARAEYARLVFEAQQFGFYNAYSPSFMPDSGEVTAEYERKVDSARKAFVRYLEVSIKVDDLATGKSVFA